MKKLTLAVLLMLHIGYVEAQEYGLAFSYFFPRNGEFSVPVTPLSYRDLGFDFNKFMGIYTGGTLYRMSGMSITQLPFESQEALAGPTFMALVPAELHLYLDVSSTTFILKGGAFGFLHLGTKLKDGNIDRAMRAHYDWAVVNSDLNHENKPGWGYHFGGEVIIYLSKKLGVNFGVQYFMGGSKMPLKGTITRVEQNGGPVIVEEVSYPDAILDMSGFEVSLGVLMSGK